MNVSRKPESLMDSLIKNESTAVPNITQINIRREHAPSNKEVFTEYNINYWINDNKYVLSCSSIEDDFKIRCMDISIIKNEHTKDGIVSTAILNKMSEDTFTNLENPLANLEQMCYNISNILNQKGSNHHVD